MTESLDRRHEIVWFEEFYFEGGSITTDLNSARFENQSNQIILSGTYETDQEETQVEVILEPADIDTFTMSGSTSDKTLSNRQLDHLAYFDRIQRLQE